MPRFALAATLLLTTLGACQFIPSRVSFENDHRIFRGPYEAEVDMRQATSTVALSEDASLLVMGGSDYGSVTQLWDVDTQTPVPGSFGESTYAEGVALTHDGTVAAVSFRGGISVWETKSDTLRYRLPGATTACAGCAASSVAFSPDGTLLAFLSGGGRPDNEVSVFDVATGERTFVLKGPGRGYDYAEVRFSPDGTRLALVGQNIEYYGSGNDWRQVTRATLWELPTGRPLGSYEQNTPTHAQADAHAWNGQSPVIGVAYEDRLELVDVTTGAPLKTVPLERGSVIPDVLFLSPDGRYAALKYHFRARGGDKLLIWDLRSARGLYRGVSDLQPLGFSADSRYLLTYNRDGVALRDPATLKADKVLVNGAVVPLHIEATPTYIDGSNYNLTGTVTLGDAPPTSFEGEATGGDTQIYVLTQPIREPSMELRFTHQNESWRLVGGQGRSASWYASLGPAAEVNFGVPYQAELEPVD